MTFLTAKKNLPEDTWNCWEKERNQSGNTVTFRNHNSALFSCVVCMCGNIINESEGGKEGRKRRGEGYCLPREILLLQLLLGKPRRTLAFILEKLELSEDISGQKTRRQLQYAAVLQKCTQVSRAVTPAFSGVLLERWSRAYGCLEYHELILLKTDWCDVSKCTGRTVPYVNIVRRKVSCPAKKF